MPSSASSTPTGSSRSAPRTPSRSCATTEPIAPYRAALLLLALATGRPQQAGAFLDAILDDGTGLAADAIDAPIPWPGIELPALKAQAEEVVRFTFHWPGQT